LYIIIYARKIAVRGRKKITRSSIMTPKAKRSFFCKLIHRYVS